MKRGRCLLAAAALAAFVLVNLAARKNDDPNPDTWEVDNGMVRAIVRTRDTVFLGGNFTTLRRGSETATRRGLAAIDIRTGELRDWTADIHPLDGSGSDGVNALEINVDGTILCVGGNFSAVKGQTRHYFAAVSTDGEGEVLSWGPDPAPNGPVHALNRTIFYPIHIYIGGIFTNIGGQSRNYAAKLKWDTGEVLPWNPNVGAGIMHGVFAIRNQAHWVYLGGRFTEVGGEERNHLAAVNDSTGAVRDWRADVTPADALLPAVNALTHKGSLYVGGRFTHIDGVARNNIAELRMHEPAGNVTDWNPGANGIVHALWVDWSATNYIYAGGEFTNIGGRSRNRLAALRADTDTNNAIDWNPNVGGGAVRAIGFDVWLDQLFVGGNFTTVGGAVRRRFARFDTAVDGQWFLPAGAVKKGNRLFDTYVLIANPGDAPATADVGFRGQTGDLGSTRVTIPARSRRTVRTGEHVPETHAEAAEVSAFVRSTHPLMAERAMYFPRGGWIGGHGTIGVNKPATRWHLPEGATHFFDQYIHIYNPCFDPVRVEGWLRDEGDGWYQINRFELPGRRSRVFHVNELPGLDGKGAVSATISSYDGPIAVDRTMYWPKGGPDAWRGGHSSRGVSGESTVWYLAEGATHQFDMYVLVVNNSGERASVGVTLQDQDGNSEIMTTDLEPGARWTVAAHDVAGWGNKAHVSTKVESLNDVPIYVERAMYWPKGGPGVWRGGHNTVASPSPALRWQLPEGANHLFDHYVLVYNPTHMPAAVTFTFMDKDGNTRDLNHSLGSGRRHTVYVNSIPGWESKDQVSTTIVSTQPILAERAMYWPKGGPGDWLDGHATIGIAE